VRENLVRSSAISRERTGALEGIILDIQFEEKQVLTHAEQWFYAKREPAVTRLMWNRSLYSTQREVWKLDMAREMRLSIPACTLEDVVWRPPVSSNNEYSVLRTLCYQYPAHPCGGERDLPNRTGNFSTRSAHILVPLSVSCPLHSLDPSIATLLTCPVRTTRQTRRAYQVRKNDDGYPWARHHPMPLFLSGTLLRNNSLLSSPVWGRFLCFVFRSLAQVELYLPLLSRPLDRQDLPWRDPETLLHRFCLVI